MQSFFTGDIIDVFSLVIFVRIWRLEEGDCVTRKAGQRNVEVHEVVKLLLS